MLDDILLTVGTVLVMMLFLTSLLQKSSFLTLLSIVIGAGIVLAGLLRSTKWN